MKSRQIDQSPKTFILVFETGDELAKGLLEFANQEKLSAASFKAVGALSSIRLGWFSWETKKYQPSVTLDEQVELLSLIGDVAFTPLEIELPCCFHDITISKRGFKPWTGRVRNNGHANVTAHLK